MPFLIVTPSLAAIQIFVGNFLEPMMMGSSLNISPFATLVSLAVWGSIWGIPGMFLCVPITVIAMIVFAHFPRTRPIAVMLSTGRPGRLGRDPRPTAPAGPTPAAREPDHERCRRRNALADRRRGGCSEAVAAIFTAAGCDAEEGARIGRYLVEANLTGHDSHGVIRVPRYVHWLETAAPCTRAGA